MSKSTEFFLPLEVAQLFGFYFISGLFAINLYFTGFQLRPASSNKTLIKRKYARGQQFDFPVRVWPEVENVEGSPMPRKPVSGIL